MDNDGFILPLSLFQKERQYGTILFSGKIRSEILRVSKFLHFEALQIYIYKYSWRSKKE